MKSLKAAAVVVGSVVVTGVAAPAAAADTPGGKSGLLTGVVKSLSKSGPLKLLQQKPQAPGTPQRGSAPSAPNGARGPAGQQGGNALLGGLPLQRG
ncbi:hypothetical protein ACFS5L_04065 [Streptomyces phyllanthi]|uniref:ATP-binding protein n=1 Tax=Streptomyces phyllanthi TaxID=1803180 RepID=A0A5N8WHR3_9ACTN|nr:hypothetical protein [Streptomyces phyllanthi]MPY46446.1 hypothetical protein [Streptomyces phyllanthi]